MVAQKFETFEEPCAVCLEPYIHAEMAQREIYRGFCGACAGFIPYQGEGFSVLLPAKWNPSKEKPFPGVVLR
jgi:hypothetical protein